MIAAIKPMPVDANDALDACPRHGTESKAEYDFGAYDATVVTYHCGCASVIEHNRIGEGATLHPNYKAAASHAKMLVAFAR